MEIIENNIKIYLSSDYGIIIGEEDIKPTLCNSEESLHGLALLPLENRTKLNRPFRLSLSEQGVSVNPIFHKEEWIKINVNNCIELSVSETFIDIYKKYVQKVWGLIILQDEKKIILG